MKNIVLFAGLITLFCQPAFAEQDIFPASETERIEFLTNRFPDIRDTRFLIKKETFRKAKKSVHHTYRIYFSGLLLYDDYIKVSTDLNGKVRCIMPHLSLINDLDENLLLYQKERWQNYSIAELQEKYFPGQKVQDHFPAIYVHENEKQTVFVLNAWDKTYDETKIISLNGEVIVQWNHQRANKIDSNVQVRIFAPDPLSIQGYSYGGSYKDFSDSNKSWLTPAYQTKSLVLKYETANNTFYLENDLAIITEIQNPPNSGITSFTPSFLYNRNEKAFEECNALYHITKFHDHLRDLGYDTLMKLQLEVDPHALFGADQSVFNRNGGNPNVLYGDGGVDDAEDADVIVHEYCHGVSWSANANANLTFERSALDEGSADYFAASYSHRFTTFQWRNIFNWDGHNEFWNGRSANVPTNYSNPFSGNIYDLGEVWSTALSNIALDIGFDVCDEILLECLHFFNDNTTLPVAAQYFMTADTLLYNGTHGNSICQRFQQKNLLTSSCTPVATKDVHPANADIYWTNSYAFARNTGDLYITSPGETSLDIFSLSGIRVYHNDFQNRTPVSPSILLPGFYLFKIQNKTGSVVFRISKY